MLELQIKTCTGCKEEKTFSSFSKCSSSADGLQYRCKTCAIEYKRSNKEQTNKLASEYRARNPEKVKESRRKCRSKNKKRYSEKSKEWYLKNRDSQIEYSARFKRENPEYHRLYRIANSAKISERSKKWRLENPEQFLASLVKRRAAKKNAHVQFANQSAIIDIYREARRLTKNTGITHHVDHIVPLQSNIVCGLHWEGNLQIITAHENLTKNNKSWPDMP